MSLLNDFRDEPVRRHHSFDSLTYDATTRSAAARGLTGTDLLVVLGFVVFAVLAFEDFVSEGNAAGQIPAAETPKVQQICSDEELRHMRGGRAACFDTSTSMPQAPTPDREAITFQGS
jgi:hypothetical protein